MTEYLLAELRNAIGNSARKPLLVCGAGVSTQATGGTAPSWAALIKSGIKRVSDLDTNAGKWVEDCNAKLENGGVAEWINVADEITDRLGGSRNAEFATWLGEMVGHLASSEDDPLIAAIVGLGCPIATTNYDDVLARATGQAPILWSDPVATHEFLFGKRDGVLHLHGHWQTASSVVLGSKSYDEHYADERSRLLQDIAALDRPTIFVGCSQDGLSDPDFSRLDSFLSEWQDVAPRRYWLVRQELDENGVVKPIPSPDNSRRLFALAFGKKYPDLVPFLREIAPQLTKSEGVFVADEDVRCIDQHEPKPEIFGRDSEIETIVNAVLSGKTALIAGGPGMGKTSVATAAFYDPGLVAQFGERRIFVSLEAAAEPRALLTQLVDALGMRDRR